MIDWLKRTFRRRSVNSSAERVELRNRTVWVKPARARFIIDAQKAYDDQSEDDNERFLRDLMIESVIDEKGDKAFGDDPLEEVDWQEFNRLRDAVMKWNTFQGDAEKN